MKNSTDLTIPNLITTARILLALIAAALFAAGQMEKLAALFCVAAAMLDAFDGWCARLISQCSELGKLLDPLADKLIITVMYTVIAVRMESVLIWFLLALMLFREIGVTLLRDFAFRRRDVLIASSRLGKIKMALQTVVGSFILLYGYFAVDDFGLPVYPVAGALILILAVAYASAHQYVKTWVAYRAQAAEHAEQDSAEYFQKEKRMVAGK